MDFVGAEVTKAAEKTWGPNASIHFEDLRLTTWIFQIFPSLWICWLQENISTFYGYIFYISLIPLPQKKDGMIVLESVIVTSLCLIN